MLLLQSDDDLMAVIQGIVDYALSDCCDLENPFWRDMRAFLIGAMNHAHDEMPLDMSISAAIDFEIARENQDGQNVIVQPKGDGE